jgi:hypothetical protein
MKKLNTKKFLSLLMTLVMVVSMFPTSAFAATTSEPYWDETATDPYIIHVATNEADDITKSQLLKLLESKWDDQTIYSSTKAYGGLKCNNIELSSARLLSGGDETAGLEKDKTYAVYVASEIIYKKVPIIGNVANDEKWATTPIATFQVVEPAPQDTIELKGDGSYNITIDTSTYEDLRAKIIDAAVASINGGEVDVDDAVSSRGQGRPHLAKQAAFGVGHDDGFRHLEQIGLHVVAGLAGTGGPDNQVVVVQMRSAGVVGHGFALGENALAERV